MQPQPATSLSNLISRITGIIIFVIISILIIMLGERTLKIILLILLIILIVSTLGTGIYYAVTSRSTMWWSFGLFVIYLVLLLTLWMKGLGYKVVPQIIQCSPIVPYKYGMPLATIPEESLSDPRLLVNLL